MTGEHRFHPAAEGELTDAAARYEAARPGWGERFAARVDRVLTSIHITPLAGSLWRGGPIRTWPVPRFPYLLVYSVEPEGVVIITVAHQKRRPGYWIGRVG